jgi:hypothetical protein
MLPEQDKQFPSGTHEAFTLEGNPTHVGIVMLMFFGNKGYFLEAELRLFKSRHSIILLSHYFLSVQNAVIIKLELNLNLVKIKNIHSYCTLEVEGS